MRSPDGVVVSTPYREASVQHIAGALFRAGRLQSFYVPLNLTRGGRLAAKRRFDPPGHSLMPVREIAFTAANRMAGRSPRPLLWRALMLDRRVARRIMIDPPAVFIGMPYASAASLAAVKRVGGIAVLNHVNADFRTENEVFAVEGARRELWSQPFITRTQDELELADRILVPSEFVHDDLVARGVTSSKIDVVPYGVDINQFAPGNGRQMTDHLSVLYVGQVGYRKGLHHLSEALKLPAARSSRLTVVGPITKGGRDLLASAEGAVYLGRVDQERLAAVYAAADVFVLPSLAEGMALVVLEAMSAGLPVIVTPETGYGGIIRDGVEGFIVPPRDAKAIADRLGRFAASPELRATMGAAARARAVQYTWDSFERNVVSALDDAVRGRDSLIGAF
jgi:glycosyltransferase involved in cell wall biosynthesis